MGMFWQLSSWLSRSTFPRVGLAQTGRRPRTRIAWARGNRRTCMRTGCSGKPNRTEREMWACFKRPRWRVGSSGKWIWFASERIHALILL